MADRPQRRHYAFTVEPVRGGWQVSNVLDYPTRGQADHAMLSLAGRHGDAAESITLEGVELKEGDLLPAHLLRRQAPSPTARPEGRTPKPAPSRTAARRSAGKGS
jgi:hypothetical protein